MEGQERLGHILRPRNFTYESVAFKGRFPCELPTGSSHSLHPTGVENQAFLAPRKTPTQGGDDSWRAIVEAIATGIKSKDRFELALL